MFLSEDEMYFLKEQMFLYAYITTSDILCQCFSIPQSLCFYNETDILKFIKKMNQTLLIDKRI